MKKINISELDLKKIIKEIAESQLLKEEACSVGCTYSYDMCPNGDDSGAKNWTANGQVGMYGSGNCEEFGVSACAAHCGNPASVADSPIRGGGKGDRGQAQLRGRMMNESQLLREKPGDPCHTRHNNPYTGENSNQCGDNETCNPDSGTEGPGKCANAGMVSTTGGDHVCCPPSMLNGKVVNCCKNKGVDMLSTKGSGFKVQQGTSHRLEKWLKRQGLNERYGEEGTRDNPPIDTGFWACHKGKGECVDQDDASGGIYGDEKRYRGLFAKWRCNRNCG